MDLNMKKLQQGAEAVLYEGVYLGKEVIVKERFIKKYRHPDLDNSLTKERIKAECRAIVKAKAAGIYTPAIYTVDLPKRFIIMQYFTNSITVKDFLLNSQYKCNFEKVAKTIGTTVAKLHSNQVVHGDLTTSNMLLVNQNDENVFDNFEFLKLALIDFGLASTDASAEDKGVDLYVLERALISLHHNANYIFPEILKAYKDGYKNGQDEVISKFEDVRARGRKRTMVG